MEVTTGGQQIGKRAAQRHVLSQRMYRLRRRYRYLLNAGLVNSAAGVREELDILSESYEDIGGKPIHKGNVL